MINIEKVYESVNKLQNENEEANILSMQTARKRNRSIMDNLMIMSPIIEKQDHKSNINICTNYVLCNSSPIQMMWEKNQL